MSIQQAAWFATDNTQEIQQKNIYEKKSNTRTVEEGGLKKVSNELKEIIVELKKNIFIRRQRQ